MHLLSTGSAVLLSCGNLRLATHTHAQRSAVGVPAAACAAEAAAPRCMHGGCKLFFCCSHPASCCAALLMPLQAAGRLHRCTAHWTAAAPAALMLRRSRRSKRSSPRYTAQVRVVLCSVQRGQHAGGGLECNWACVLTGVMLCASADYMRHAGRCSTGCRLTWHQHACCASCNYESMCCCR